MAVQDEERQLWCIADVECLMLSCCSGAELQIRGLEGEILLRELYPTKSDLFERARSLEAEYRKRLSSPNH